MSDTTIHDDALSCQHSATSKFDDCKRGDRNLDAASVLTVNLYCVQFGRYLTVFGILASLSRMDEIVAQMNIIISQ